MRALRAERNPHVGADVSREGIALGLATEAKHQPDARVADADRLQWCDLADELWCSCLEERDRQTHAQSQPIEQGSRELDVTDQRARDDRRERATAGEHVGLERGVRVVERDARGEIAGLGIPGPLEQEEPAARGRPLVAVESEATLLGADE